MTQEPGNQAADMQSLSDTTAGIYEAVATLEHGGRQPRRSVIIDATGLEHDVVEHGLDDLVSAGLLVTAGERGDADPVYVPSSRGWSAAPEQAEGHHLL
jgi:hypothetical protein